MPFSLLSDKETVKEKFLAAIDVFAEIVYLIYQKFKLNKCIRSENSDGDQTDGLDEDDRNMFLDAFRDFILQLYLTDDEAKLYDQKKKRCWESPDPIKCKSDLDEEYRKLIFSRLEKPKSTASELSIKIYVSAISAMTYFIKKFAAAAGLPDIQCKTDVPNNATWIRFPELLECNLLNFVTDPIPTPTSVPSNSRRVNAKCTQADQPDTSIPDEIDPDVADMLM